MRTKEIFAEKRGFTKMGRFTPDKDVTIQVFKSSESDPYFRVAILGETNEMYDSLTDAMVRFEKRCKSLF